MGANIDFTLHIKFHSCAKSFLLAMNKIFQQYLMIYRRCTQFMSHNQTAMFVRKDSSYDFDTIPNIFLVVES